jgi:hypothetical protein
LIWFRKPEMFGRKYSRGFHVVFTVPALMFICAALGMADRYELELKDGTTVVGEIVMVSDAREYVVRSEGKSTSIPEGAVRSVRLALGTDGVDAVGACAERPVFPFAVEVVLQGGETVFGKLVAIGDDGLLVRTEDQERRIGLGVLRAVAGFTPVDPGNAGGSLINSRLVAVEESILLRALTDADEDLFAKQLSCLVSHAAPADVVRVACNCVNQVGLMIQIEGYLRGLTVGGKRLKAAAGMLAKAAPALPEEFRAIFKIGASAALFALGARAEAMGLLDDLSCDMKRGWFDRLSPFACMNISGIADVWMAERGGKGLAAVVLLSDDARTLYQMMTRRAEKEFRSCCGFAEGMQWAYLRGDGTRVTLRINKSEESDAAVTFSGNAIVSRVDGSMAMENLKWMYSKQDLCFYSIAQNSMEPLMCFPAREGQAWQWRRGDVEFFRRCVSTDSETVCGQRCFRPCVEMTLQSCGTTEDGRPVTMVTRQYYAAMVGLVKVEPQDDSKREFGLKIVADK